MAKTLVSNVLGNDGVWYGPDYGNAEGVPDQVASDITNPAAWEAEAPAGAFDNRTRRDDFGVDEDTMIAGLVREGVADQIGQMSAAELEQLAARRRLVEVPTLTSDALEGLSAEDLKELARERNVDVPDGRVSREKLVTALTGSA